MFNIEYKNIAKGLKYKGLRLVQISDLHISRLNLYLIDRVKDTLNSLKADIVVVTGDVICNGGAYLRELQQVLKNIDATTGKFACMGNHDYADGEDGLKVERAFSSADFRVLKNSRVDFLFNNNTIGFCGLDDYTHGNVCFDAIVRGDIVLSHNPITFLQAKMYQPDLMLSGHTHGGQIKWDFFKALYHKRLGCNFLSGFYEGDDGNGVESLLYVNRGLGNVVFKPKFFSKEFLISTPRINSPAEVTVFEFE